LSEIGIGLTAVGIFFTILSVALFFDGALLAVGNVSNLHFAGGAWLNTYHTSWSEPSVSTASVPFRSRIDPRIREDQESLFPTTEAARNSPFFLRNIFGYDEMVLCML
jgi:hypothetical protein